jgi:hypothetical protein
MSADRYHLALYNIARMRAPLDSAELADFVALLDPLNRLADESPGFVWRLQTEDGTSSSIRPYDDDMILINLSTWESIESLRAYTYRGAHGASLRRRREWFERHTEPYMVLWWVPAGHTPSVQEGRERLEYLIAHGESAHAFMFRRPFPPPAAVAEQVEFDKDW